MTREQQLNFCNICVNRKTDDQNEIICKLTNQKADFDKDCVDFKQDSAFDVKAQNEIQPQLSEELKAKITPDIYERLRLEQNLIGGILAGILAGVVGALLWGVITVVTEYQIGYMAIAIGFGVGFAIRYVGKGIDMIFGILGAFIAILSCILGNFFSTVGFIAHYNKTGYLDTLLLIDYQLLPDIFIETFNPMDLLFYALAAYEGYRFAFRQITDEDINKFNTYKVNSQTI